MNTSLVSGLRSALVLAGVAGLLVLSSASASTFDPIPFPSAAVPDGDHTPPKVLRRVEPVCPAEIPHASGELRVYVAFIVNGEGRVRQAAAMFSPPAAFAQAAVAAVEQWEFEPGRLRAGGRPVHTQMTVELWFRGPAAQSAGVGQPDAVSAVLAAYHRMNEAATRLDGDGMFAGILDEADTRIIQNGTLFTTRQEAAAAVAQSMAGIARTERTFDEPLVTILAPDVALLTTSGTVSVALEDGRTFSSPFAVSLVFVRRGNEWKVLVGHHSVPPQ